MGKSHLVRSLRNIHLGVTCSASSTAAAAPTEATATAISPINFFQLQDKSDKKPTKEFLMYSSRESNAAAD